MDTQESQEGVWIPHPPPDHQGQEDPATEKGQGPPRAVQVQLKEERGQEVSGPSFFSRSDVLF